MGIKNLTFVDSNPPQCDAEWLNSVVGEVNNVIDSTGAVSTVSDLNQLGAAMTEYSSGADFYTDSGAADAYVLTVVGSKNASTQYFNGMRIRFLPGNANTGASTVNVSTLGAKNIKLADGSTDPSAGDIPASTEVQLTYDGTNFRLVAGAASSALLAANNLSDVASAATSRTNLGLGTMATQAASSVAITGGTITGVTGFPTIGYNFDGTGTPAFRDQFGCTSITDSGTGDYTVNLTTAVATTDIVVQGGQRAAGSVNDGGIQSRIITTTTIDVNTSDAATTATDWEYICGTVLKA